MGLGTFNKFMIINSKKGKTLIGGIGASINTASLLATKLAIDESTIKNFEVIDNDVHCYITKEYNIPSYCFQSNTELTSYWDYDGMVQNIDGYAFDSVEKATHYYFPYCLTLGYRTFAAPGYPNVHTENLKVLYIPRCIRIGTSNTINENNFWYGSFNKCNAYFHPMMETVNNGGKEPDIANNLSYAPYAFLADIYVSNFEQPDVINDLQVTENYKQYVKIQWTEPYSINGIYFYEIYIDGVLYDTAQDTYIRIWELVPNQNYTISIKSIDIFYNKSKKSNINILVSNININSLSYFRFQNNLLDELNYGNSTSSYGVTYLGREHNRKARLNGLSSYINIEDKDGYSFTDGVGQDLPFTIDFIFYAYNNGGGNGIWFINKRDNLTNHNEWQIIYYQGQLRMYLYGLENINEHQIYIAYTYVLPLNTYTHLCMKYDGSKTSAGLSMYINGQIITPTERIDKGYTGMTNTNSVVTIGARGWDVANGNLNGIIDELEICQYELTDAEINERATIKLNEL